MSETACVVPKKHRLRYSYAKRTDDVTYCWACSIASLRQRIEEQAKRIEELEAESDGRRNALLVKAEELRREWVRAEQAESERESLRPLLDEFLAGRSDEWLRDAVRAALARNPEGPK